MLGHVWKVLGPVWGCWWRESPKSKPSALFHSPLSAGAPPSVCASRSTLQRQPSLLQNLAPTTNLGSFYKFGHFLEPFDCYARSDHCMDSISPGRSEKNYEALRPRFPNANCDLTVQQAVDIGQVGRACIPPQESLFSLLWLIEPFTGTLPNHRMVSLTSKQTQALRRRHGKAGAPKSCSPPLRHAGCFTFHFHIAFLPAWIKAPSHIWSTC